MLALCRAVTLLVGGLFRRFLARSKAGRPEKRILRTLSTIGCAALDDELPADTALAVLEGSGNRALDAALTRNPPVVVDDVIGSATPLACCRVNFPHKPAHTSGPRVGALEAAAQKQLEASPRAF